MFSLLGSELLHFFICEIDFIIDEIKEGETNEIVTEKRNFTD